MNHLSTGIAYTVLAFGLPFMLMTALVQPVKAQEGDTGILTQEILQTNEGEAETVADGESTGPHRGGGRFKQHIEPRERPNSGSGRRVILRQYQPPDVGGPEGDSPGTAAPTSNPGK